jgi:hypothetical protein
MRSRFGTCSRRSTCKTCSGTTCFKPVSSVRLEGSSRSPGSSTATTRL